MGFPADSVDTLRHGLTLSAVGEDALLGAELLYQYGAALADSGDARRARDVWHTSMEAFERINARQWVGRLRKRLSDGGNHRYF